MRRGIRRNRGISTIIANLLMIMFMLSIASMLVAYAGTSYSALSYGYTLSFDQKEKALKERFVIEKAWTDHEDLPLDDDILLFVRSVGLIEVSVVRIYVSQGGIARVYSGSALGVRSPCTLQGNVVTMPVGSVCAFKLEWDGEDDLPPATTQIVVASQRGNQAYATMSIPPPETH